MIMGRRQFVAITAEKRGWIDVVANSRKVTILRLTPLQIITVIRVDSKSYYTISYDNGFKRILGIKRRNYFN